MDPNISNINNCLKTTDCDSTLGSIKENNIGYLWRKLNNQLHYFENL